MTNSPESLDDKAVDTFEGSLLNEDCGHHCGVMMTGAAQYAGHCACFDCHDRT